MDTIMETVVYRFAITLSAQNGALPSPQDVEQLVYDQMGGTLDEDTGLVSTSVALLPVENDGGIISGPFYDA